MTISNDYSKVKNDILTHTQNIISSRQKVQELKQDQRKLLRDFFKGHFEMAATDDQIQQLQSLDKVLTELAKDNPNLKRTSSICQKLGRIYDNQVNGRLRSKKLKQFIEVQLKKPEFQVKIEAKPDQEQKNSRSSSSHSDSETSKSHSNEATHSHASRSSDPKAVNKEAALEPEKATKKELNVNHRLKPDPQKSKNSSSSSKESEGKKNFQKTSSQTSCRHSNNASSKSDSSSSSDSESSTHSSLTSTSSSDSSKHSSKETNSRKESSSHASQIKIFKPSEDELKKPLLSTSINDLPQDILQKIFEAPFFNRWKKDVKEFFPSIAYVSKAFAQTAMKTRFTYLRKNQAFLSDIAGKEKLIILNFIKKHAKQLSTINLQACYNLTPLDIRQIAKDCPNIDRLFLAGSCITEDFYKEIALLKNLKCLEFYSCKKLTKFDLSLPSLEILRMPFCEGIKSISLENLINLKELKLNYISSNAIPASFPSTLEKVKLVGASPKDLFSRLSSSPLTEFYLDTYYAGTSSLEPFNLPHLKKLTFKAQAVDNLNFLSMMPALEEVSLSIGKLFDSTSLSFLKDKHSLQKLTLEGMDFEDTWFFKNIKNLKELNLNSCTLQSISPLQEVKFLEVLNVADCSSLNRTPSIHSSMHLREVSYSKCPSISSLKHYKPSAGNLTLPEFRSIKITDCSSFKKLNLHFPSLPNLKHVEITGCLSFESSSEIAQLPDNCWIKLNCTGLDNFEGTVKDWKKQFNERMGTITV